MSSNCMITIKNQSGLPQQYIRFAAPPKTPQIGGLRQHLDYKAVVLGDVGRNGTTARVRVTDDAPQFDNSIISPRGPDGAFTIQTMTDFFIPNSTNIFIGLGGESADGDGTVISIFTFVVSRHTFHLAPVIKYYIGTGSYSESKIIDIDDIGPFMLADFAGNNPKNVVLIR